MIKYVCDCCGKEIERKDEIKQKGYEIRTVKEDNELKEITRKLQKLLFFKGEIESLVNDNLF